MRTRLILQAILLLCVVRVLSQSTYTYEGFVQNEQGEKLIGVQFISPTDSKVIAISDDNGHFKFTSVHNHLSVSYLGYEIAFIKSESNGSNSILVLKETTGLLNAIVVSENKRETSLKNATVSLEIIKPSLISNTAPTNMEESIGRINGVQVVDNQPTIRSGSGWSYGAGSRVQVLVDGVPMLSGDAGQPLWTFLPTEGIDGVEIIKGASSVIYGSSALNGVINIKTKKPSTTPYTQVNLSTGIYDLPKRQSLHYQGNKRNTISNLTLYHASSHKNLGVTFGLNLLNDEGYKMSDYDKRARASLGLRKTIAEKNLTYGINTTYQQGKSGSFLLWESYELGYTALDSGATDNNVNRLSIDPYITWYKGKFTHTINTRYLNINNQVDNGDTATNQSNSSNLVYAEYQTKFSLIPYKFYVTSGLVAINTVSESPLYSGNQTATNYAAYIQADKTWNRLTASAGARYELFKLNTRKEGKPVVRAGLNYKAAQFTYIRASYGQGYRFPSIAESYIKTTVGPVSIFANSNLNSESGTNKEIGIKQGLQLRGVQMMIDIAAFEMAFNNMMEFTFGQWGPVAPPLFGAGFKTLNTGKARVRGVEFNIGFLKKTKDIEIEGFAGYTFAHSEALEPNKIIGEDIGGTPLTFLNTSSDTNAYALKYRPKHVAKADIMVSYKKWHFGAGVSFQSEVTNVDAAFTSWPISQIIPGVQQSIDKKLTAFTLINTRIGYDLASQWKTNLLISNITNSEYAIRPADLGAPRSIRLQITYTLDKSK